MYSLYSTLLAQHARQLTPVRCGAHTISQLHRYLEEVILDNKLAALMVQSIPLVAKRSVRELHRIKELGNIAANSFFLVANGDPIAKLAAGTEQDNKFVCLELDPKAWQTGKFVIIADARFSALIASPPSIDTNDAPDSDLEAVWTFEPDIVYSALEYLMARLTAEFPERAVEFSHAVRHSMPKATSLQLALSVTTKLAQLLQAQAEREIAVNRIATAVRNAIELESILQTAAAEVGRVLNVSSCGIRVDSDSGELRTTRFYLNEDAGFCELEQAALMKDLDTLSVALAESPATAVLVAETELETILPRAVVPLKHNGRFIGMLLVRSNEASRCWTESEQLLLHTVSDQLTVAVNQARLFAQLQQQALTDQLTGCYNRRALVMQLDRDLQFATRTRQPLSVLMVDLDHLKGINDRFGHDGGDNALRLIAEALRSELRGVDTAARYGGDEFAIILPQADLEGALLVAERLRGRIEGLCDSQIGSFTASFGVASFPEHGSCSEALVILADRTLYKAKRTGRNRVCFPEEGIPEPNVIFSEREDTEEMTHLVID